MALGGSGQGQGGGGGEWIWSKIQHFSKASAFILETKPHALIAKVFVIVPVIVIVIVAIFRLLLFLVLCTRGNSAICSLSKVLFFYVYY